MLKEKNSVGSYNPGLLPDVSSRRDVVQKQTEKNVHPGLGCQLHRNLNRIHSKYVDCVTAPSALTLNVLLDDGFFKNSEKKVIANATDFDIDAVKKILSVRVAEVDKRQGVSFVYLGTLSEQKVSVG